MHSIREDTDNQRQGSGEMSMLVSGIVGTASLVAILVLLFVAGLVLAAVDKHFDAGREH